MYSTTELNGTNTIWIQESSDLIGNVVAADITSRESDGRVAVGTHGRGVFIGDILSTNIPDHDRIVQKPEEFFLSQNYPNPFNAITSIGYTIPYEQHIKLKIFDSLGREIETLIDEKKQPGTHTVTFDANKLASGLYVYKLTAENHVFTKKMILLK